MSSDAWADVVDDNVGKTGFGLYQISDGVGVFDAVAAFLSTLNGMTQSGLSPPCTICLTMTGLSQ